ncbi:Uncharacterised protein [Enterobacter hormaechei]|nr:hypothetical protein CITFRE_25710 [Citrobacter freundii]SAI20989.1 Uncharacterised protein [Enterobacter hormaechei]VGD48785.1 Uncharacterised protein [Klebsiella pneumoniae]
MFVNNVVHYCGRQTLIGPQFFFDVKGFSGFGIDEPKEIFSDRDTGNWKRLFIEDVISSM